MSLRNHSKGADNSGWKRGAGAYSKDYASFDRSETEYSGKNIYQKVESTGDYDGVFTGPVSTGDRNRWTPLADRQNTRGDGKYSHEGRRSTERPRKQSDGKAVGGQKVSD